MHDKDDPVFVFYGPLGVRVELHGSILFLAVLMVGLGGTSVDALLHGAIVFVMLVISIFLHELGHAWGALVQGVPVRRIVLYGGGGYCEHKPTTTRQSEFIIAMGPVVTLALWAVLSLAAWYVMRGLTGSAMGGVQSPGQLAAGIELYGYLQMFAVMNLVLFIMNMVPVQPLDGGGLLHHWMLRLLPSHTALRVVGLVGLVLSVLWIPAMLWVYLSYGWMLLFVPSIWGHWQMLRGNVPVA